MATKRLSGQDQNSNTLTNVPTPSSGGDAANKTYVDGKVADAINDGTTTIAPSQNAVFDQLALKQPLDSDLTTIAGLTATTDNFMVASASAWASRTPAQARTHMGLGSIAVLAAPSGTVVGTSDSQTLTAKTYDTPIITKYDGWITGSSTWTYASATTFTVPAADAAAMQIGDKVKLTQTTVKYFNVVGISGTTITITGGTDYTLANAAITSPFFSHMASPVGFPASFAFTPTVTSGTGTFTSVASVGRFRIMGRLCTFWQTITTTTVGTAAQETRTTLPVTASGNANQIMTGAGQETNNTGDALIGRITNTNQLSIRNYINGFSGGTNAVQRMTINYEI